MSTQESASLTENQSNENVHKEPSSATSKREASWPFVLFYIHLNILGLYGLIVLFTNTSLTTVIFTFILTFLGIIGTTAGSHRLWAHNTYKANKVLKIFLMLCQTMAGQGSIYNWVRAHRLHHEKFKQDDDPFYSKKDFFSAHVTAQLRGYSVEQEKMLEAVDMKDLEEDDVVMFQKRFYWILYSILFVLLPINAPLEYWGDNVSAAIFVAFSLRYLIVLNVSWLINSGHFIWALDKNQKSSDSNMIFFVTKSYWPEYHYMLPKDYQVNEFGGYGTGFTTISIRVFASLGLASDVFTITTNAVKQGLMNAIDRKKTGVDEKKTISESIMECAIKDFENLPYDHYINKKVLV
ncbi:acyl-CoA Delta-9 desaturase [Condylostylus longicornis]|uniref:acyl-CoA Delta-9 desaturase n=1 Tax=Condylostylus longicornis TaxID=2530218 RepID=UPI00244DC980|nr:acyl-CoA Delta-9 desaturase [Condylostylus longicornis]XP_055379288.1 acyl-CoA Delta-9 desaturase [Condylostylus longicornis]XP_055379294.1 acyl-CoA Delta-9 desaturase [Condylostylus longicornis]